MIINTITISRGVTINLGNYESLRLDVQMIANVEQGDNDLVRARVLREMVLDELENQLMDLDIAERLKLSHVAMLRTAK